MLHILMNSPFKINTDFLFKILSPEDDLIALQDGVFIGIEKGVFYKYFTQSSIKLYLLKEDIIARGILSNISNKFHIVNYCRFITLTEKHQSYMNW